MARVRDSLLPGESRGIKDYSNFTQDRWYPSTSDEINNGHVPQGASLYAVLDKGSNIIKELVAPSTPPTVDITGSPSVASGNGYKKYTFSGGSKGTAEIKTIDYDSYVDYGNLQGCDTAFSYTQITLPTAVSKPANPTKQSTITFVAPANISKGQKVTITLASIGYSNLYDCTTWEHCYRASDISRAYIAKGAYVSGGGSSSGGSITINDYIPEETRDRKWGHFTRVSSSAETTTRTFLVQGELR